MIRFKQSFPPVGLLLSFLALLTLESCSLQRARAEAQRALANLRKLNAEHSMLAREKPGPSEENETAIARDRVAATEAVSAWRFAVGNRADGSLPKTPTAVEAYFEISGGIEQLRARAQAAQVTLKPGEGFGFASHRAAGPDTALAPVVLRQCRALQGLVETLLETRPLALLAVQRQRPTGKTDFRPGVSDGATPAAKPDGLDQVQDFFDLAPALDLRLPENLSGQAYRLEFSGTTRMLRDFLNRLAAQARPVFVRSVEVEPLDTDKSADSREPPPSREKLVPLVTRNLSRFTVIVQLLDPDAGPEGPAS